MKTKDEVLKERMSLGNSHESWRGSNFYKAGWADALTWVLDEGMKFKEPLTSKRQSDKEVE